jgi:hypothetical protein
MKKKLVRVLVALAPLIALACALVVISILVLAVGAVVIYQLYKVVSVKLPPTATNNAVFYNDIYERSNLASVVSVPITKPLALAGGPAGFALQYAVCSADGLPRIFAGTNPVVLPAPFYNPDGWIYCFENDAAWFDFVVAIPGAGAQRVQCDPNSGDVTNLPLNVVIESSPDLVSWTAIFTNSECVVDATNSFNDPAAPPDQNFYRVKYY